MDWAGVGGLLVGAAALGGLLLRELRDRKKDTREELRLDDEHEEALSALVTQRLDIFIRGQAAAYEEVRDRLVVVEKREAECREELGANRAEITRLRGIVDRRLGG